MSHTRKRRKKSNVSSMSRVQCNSCQITFANSDLLFNHKMESDSDDCRKDLVHCKNCSKAFLTFRGLQMHQVKSPQCLRVQNLENTVSVMEFEISSDLSMYEDDDSSSTNNSSHHGGRSDIDDEELDDIDHEDLLINVEDIGFNVINGKKRKVVPEKVHLKRSLLCVPMTSKAGLRQIRNTDHSKFQIFGNDFKPCVLQFQVDCIRDKKKLGLDIDNLRKDDNMSLQDHVILDCFELTKFKDPTIFEELSVVLVTFWNHCAMITGLISSDDNNVTEERLLSFLFLYALIEDKDIVHDVEDGNDSSNVSLEDMDSLDPLNDDDCDNREVESGCTVVEEDGHHRASDMLLFQHSIEKAREDIVFENTEIAKVELYTMLSKANCPKYLFEDVQRWAIKYGKDMFGTLPTKRNNFINAMGRKVYGEDGFRVMKPKTDNLLLPRGSTIPVVSFSLKGAIMSLLTNLSLMKEDNLLLDRHNPLHVPNRTSLMGEINTGWWYHETVESLCNEPRDILLPILVFIDGSNVDNNRRLSVEPVTLTLGIFNRQTRNQSDAWRSVGFMESLSNKISEDVMKSKQPIAKMQDYHAILDHILRELKHIQGKKGGFDWELTMMGKKYSIVFKVAVQVVIGDCKGNDMLCGRFGSHSKSTRGFCRDCNVTYESADDPYHVCEFFTQTDIAGKCKDELQSFGFHHISNAFDDVCFGARNLGIYGSSPSEPLHSFKLGLCKYLYEGFSRDVPPTTVDLIDKKIARMISRGLNQSINDLPSLQVLRKGLNGCATLGGDDQLSQIFGIQLCLLDPMILESLATDPR